MTPTTSSYQDIPVNPFKDDVVKRPSDVSFSVEGLNDAQLEELLTAFSELDAQSPPHEPVGAGKMQLVVSPEGGYGKSHLLGRLFAGLGMRATKVYIPPFQDPEKPWHSILRRALHELDRPDVADESDDASAQIEAFAVAVLGHVAADFIAAGGMPASSKGREAAAALRKAAEEPAMVDAKSRRWLEWVEERLRDTRDAARMGSLLRKHDIDLEGREIAWLKVLATVVLEEPDSDRRSAAAKWLRAEPLEPEEVAMVGLDAASNDAHGDAPPKEVNDLCFQRLQGLCLLASYHRPFLFCFDQSEFYARDEALVKTLGNCIYQLFEQLRNHLSIITTNEATWLDEIRPHIEPPQRQRLSKEIRLDGIDREGARELIAERLSEYCLARHDIQRFFADDWMDSVFSILPDLPVRTVLEQAAARFKLLAKGVSEPPPKPSLDELFRQELEGATARNASLYDEDSLVWFVREMGAGLPGVSVERLRRQRYFSLEWVWPDRRVSFAFEGGSHWRRWGAIMDEAEALVAEGRAPAFLSYVLRTPELKKVPAHAWPRLEAAAKQGFQLFELTAEQACEIQAAFSLYSNALQENLVYSGDETLTWLQARFAPLLKDLAYREMPAVEQSAA